MATQTMRAHGGRDECAFDQDDLGGGASSGTGRAAALSSEKEGATIGLPDDVKHFLKSHPKNEVTGR